METPKQPRYNSRNNLSCIHHHHHHHQYVGDGVDRISEMSDDIIVSILSHLTCDEGFRTSLLSKRWKTCWMLTKAIKFDDRRSSPTRPQDQTRSIQSHEESFVKKVTRILSLLKSPNVESLQLRCYFFFPQDYKSDIDAWIKFSLEKKPESLKIILMDEGSRPDHIYKFEYYAFPTNLLTSTNVESLRSISLAFDVTDDVFRYFLSSCPFLENLTVSASYSLESPIVDGPSLNLKYLKISNCYKMKSVQISAPKLLSYHHSGGEASVLLKDTPRLSDLLIGGWCENLPGQLRHFFGYFSQLESLTLYIIHEAHWIREELPQLTNLRHLEMRFQIYAEASSRLSYFSLMMACPSLRSVKVKRNVSTSSLYSSYDLGEKISVEWPVCSFKYLKVVESDGFVGCRHDLEILTFLLQLRAPIDKVIIRIIEPTMGLTEIQKLLIRDRALNIKLPPGAHLLILNGDPEKMWYCGIE